MESSTQSAQPPLKICPRCSAASRTDSETCPNCGRRYRRRWRLLAIGAAVVAVAFAAGYGGKLLLSDDGGNDSSAITAEQANAVPLGISRPELVDRLNVDPTVVKPVGGGQMCLFYPLAGQSDSAWAFCFARGKLKSSSSQSEESGGGASQSGKAPLPVNPSH